MNQNTVMRYAAQMMKGEWDWCDGDSPLKFGKGGVNRNGQHRLLAQVLANVTGCYDIRTGVPEESYAVMDTGRTRAVADYFYGKERSVDVSSIARKIVWARHGFISPSGSLNGVHLDQAVTRSEEIEFAKENYERLLAYVRLGSNIRDQNGRGGPAVYGAALYVEGMSLEDATAFVRAYVDGADETSVTKATVLKKLADRNFKPREQWFCGICLMAYDAWKSGRGVKVLRQQDVIKRYRKAVDRFCEQPESGVV